MLFCIMVFTSLASLGEIWEKICLFGLAWIVLTISFQMLPKRKVKLDKSKCIVVITGCDTGFGNMAALSLSKQGFQVIATCMTTAGKSELAPHVAQIVLCDVTKADNVAQLGAAVDKLITEKQFKLWAVINNAGIGIFGLIDCLSLDVMRRMMEVNYFGLVAVTKTMLPFLKQTPESRIINISSVAGLGGSALFGESIIISILYYI